MKNCFKCENARVTKYKSLGCAVNKDVVSPYGSCKDFEESYYIKYDVDKLRENVSKITNKKKK